MVEKRTFREQFVCNCINSGVQILHIPRQHLMCGTTEGDVNVY